MDANTPGIIGDPKLSVVFPAGDEVGMRSLSVIVHMLGCSVLAYCLALRSHNEDIFSLHGLRSISWPRWLLLFLFVDSWIFLFLAGVLVNGVGMSLSNLACQLGILLCIIFYALSKVLIYLFLIERVHVVWPNKGTTRWSSTAYRVCLAGVMIYGAIFALMIFGRISYIKEDRQCVIGLEKPASLSLLLYDLLLNVFLTAMFLFPLQQNHSLNPKLKIVARRTLAAATMALLTSAVNIAVLTILHGQEYGWVCLASCGTDTVLNAMVIVWVTRTQDDHYSTDKGPLGGNALVGTASEAEIPRFTVASDRKDLNTPTTSSYSFDTSPRLNRSNPESANVATVRAPMTSRAGHLDLNSTRSDTRPVLTDIEEIEIQSRNHIGREPRRSASRSRNIGHLRRRSTGWGNMLAQVFGFDEQDEDVGSVSVQVTVTTQTSVLNHHPRRGSSIPSVLESPQQLLDDDEDRPPTRSRSNDDVERGTLRD
jgi:hypothetical protein